MKPADAYRLKYRADETVEPSNTAGVDSLPDELLAHILAPVDLKSLTCAQGDDNEGCAGPFDILVTDDLVGDEREWQKTWWRSVFDRSMKEYTGCTCAVVGREILIFGGPNELHLAQEMYNIDLSAREGFRNEESDTLFSIDGLEPRFRAPYR